MPDRFIIPGSDRGEIAPRFPSPRALPAERLEVTMRTKFLDSTIIAKISDFAKSSNLVVIEVNKDQDFVKLSGNVSSMNYAFGVDLHNCDYVGGTHRSHYGPVSVPDGLADIVDGVFGLDDRPVANPHFRIQKSTPVRVGKVSEPAGTFTPPQVAKAYSFPNVAGAGQTVAIIELGGGFNKAQMSEYFTSLGITTPVIKQVSIDGGKNKTGTDADGEVQLDIQVVGSIAYNSTIIVYFTPNTDRGFMDAVSAAVAASVSAISISWGGPESSWTQMAMNSFDKIFQKAVSKGITVYVAAGDNGSDDGVGDGTNHVDFPASSPNVCACGGTKLTLSGSIPTDVVWNENSSGNGATGGGYSILFKEPAYQLTTRPGRWRGVPDVAGNADPVSGFDVSINGQSQVIGGTSAVAPLFAALHVLINQASGKNIGFINPILYANPQVCRDVTSGNNGAYSATVGWDACTGLGCINGSKLLSVV